MLRAAFVDWIVIGRSAFLAVTAGDCFVADTVIEGNDNSGSVRLSVALRNYWRSQ